MKTLEQTARRMCGLDLHQRGFPLDEAESLADRFWPVVANEIRQGVTLVGEWPFTVEEINVLTAEYQALNPQ
ncbi:hypothetical protein [Ancylobacter oerskovii]|uniref:Uncharacterized protein n=1 Tax=Ancylobacter oerskovii TaxID=459519 RepID=A0ABW4YVX2_9HYPH|nr:hypothetical protein [Ancylobacter oerskovii]MBS7544324.1 hypothetical protein [Ancylobacter oerskovii]